MPFKSKVIRCAIAMSVAATAAFTLPSPTLAQTSSERAVALAQLAKEKGVKTSFDSASEGLDKAAKFARSLKDKDSRMDLGQLASGLETLGNLSEHASYLGAAIDLALLFVPEAPDPVLVALNELQDSVDDLHRDVLEGFQILEDKDNRNFLDLQVKGAASDITGDYIVYLAYMETLEKMHNRGEVIYPDEVQEISGSKLYAATDTLAELCTGTVFFGGRNVFDAHLKVTHGNINEAILIGHYILTKITEAQTAHGAKVLYGAKSELTAAATKTTLEVMNAKHEKHFETCHDALADTITEYRRERSLKSYARKFLKNFPGRDLSAKKIGVAMREQFPFWEWAVVSYPYKEGTNPIRTDKRKENWDGNRYVKTIAQDRQVVIASFFAPSGSGRKELTGCQASLIRYNKALHDNWMKTGQQIGRPRAILERKCKDAGDEAPLVWASSRLDATTWTSDPLAVYATDRKKMDIYGLQKVKYMIVGTDTKRCAGIKPRWSRLAGIGGRSTHAHFVTRDNKTSRYYHNDHHPEDNCFTTRPQSYSDHYSIDAVGDKLSAILDNTGFDKEYGGYGTNYAFLNDGTYVRYKTYADFEDDIEIGLTSDAFPGISFDQSKRIVATTALTTKERIYFFLDDGNYLRFDPKTKRVDQKLWPIGTGWSGVRDDIVAAGDFVDSSGAIYFFYSDGQYGRYDVKQQRVTYEGSASGWK